LKRHLWDPRYEKLREARDEQEREARIVSLGPTDRDRVRTLADRQKEIRLLAAVNPSFTGELLRAELVKTDKLVYAFIDLAVTCALYQQYLDSVALVALGRERTRWEVNSKHGAEDDPQVKIAKQNLAVIMKRQEKVHELQQYLTVARGQLDLIDNSFQLIADQI